MPAGTEVNIRKKTGVSLVDKTPELIDQLIAEHKVISQRSASLEKAANDAGLLSGLKKTRERFTTDDLSRGESLKELDEMLAAITSRLERHFKREETVLLPAVEKYGNEKLVNTLNSLLFEHSELRDRLLHSRKRVDELRGGSLDEAHRDASAHDFGIYLNHSRKLLETHAGRENHFFNELRRHLKKTASRKEKKS
jgi:hemerythrin-like domain-containing protein